jgi:iron complex outermembrane receptor protein
MNHFLTACAFVLAASAQAQVPTDTTRIGEVVVTGTRQATDARHLSSTVNVITRDQLTRNHQQNLLPALMDQIPGIFITSRSMMGYGVSTGAAGGINLRGIAGGSGQLLVLIDGHPQYNGVYGHPIADSYQTFLADRVEVLRGPASMLYGSNAMGGVINIVTRKMNTDGMRNEVSVGGGSYGTFQADAESQLRSGRFNSTLSLQYGRSDNHRPRMGFEQYGGNAKLGYELSARWNAYLDLNVTHFNAEHPGQTSSPLYGAEQWITRGAAVIGVENHYERTNGAIGIYTNFGRHKIDDGSNDPATPTQRYFRSEDYLAGVNLYQSARLWQGSRATLGFDYQHIYGHAWYTSKQDGSKLDTPNKQSGKSARDEVAVYAELSQDVTSWLTANAGLRFDHHNVSGTEWVPQFGLIARLLPTGELRASAAKGFRNPTMRELYLYPPSNEDLRAERIWNYELAWSQRLLQGRLRYGVNLFYLNGDNLIQTINRRNVNTGKIENWGAEAEASYRLSRAWTLSTNHSLLHMEHKVVSAPSYKGYLGGTFNRGRWGAQGGLTILSRLFTSTEAGAPTEDAVLLNLGGSYQATKAVSLWARGENLLAQKYELQLGYPMPRATFMGGVSVRF